MGYAIRADLEDRYGADEVAQRESTPLPGAVDRALADADTEIDSFVAIRYTVPLSPVPANVARLAAAIARYRLLGEAVTEVARKDYEDAIRWLRAVADGKAGIDGAVPAVAPAVTRLVEFSSGRRKAFNGGLS